uniref:Uncharacterized protein n=1 Tax=Peronospora matthiolae TaxID=2874970 RepID=A0AAV1TR23_9STRA
MQKAFAEAFPDNLELQITVWHMKRETPRYVYDLLPIGQREEVIRDGKQCLIKESGADEVEKAFSALRNIPGMKNRAKKLQWVLNVLMAKSDEWLKTRTSPKDLRSRPDLICKLSLWLEYADSFRAEYKTFSEVDEFDLLLSKREPEEMTYFFHFMKIKTQDFERFGMHQKRLFYKYPDRVDLLLPRLEMNPSDAHAIMFGMLLDSMTFFYRKGSTSKTDSSSSLGMFMTLTLVLMKTISYLATM